MHKNRWWLITVWFIHAMEIKYMQTLKYMLTNGFWLHDKCLNIKSLVLIFQKVWHNWFKIMKNNDIKIETEL